LRILEVPGVVRLVGFNGLPAALPDTEMEIMRAGLSGNFVAEPHQFLNVGQRVRIIAGPFAGLEGVLRRKKNDVRVVVSIDIIQRAIALEVGITELEVTQREYGSVTRITSPELA
jgi:transcription antitermination factor NusG